MNSFCKLTLREVCDPTVDIILRSNLQHLSPQHLENSLKWGSTAYCATGKFGTMFSGLNQHHTTQADLLNSCIFVPRVYTIIFIAETPVATAINEIHSLNAG